MTEEVWEEGAAEHNMLIVNNEGDGDGASGGDALVRGNMVQVGYAGCAGWSKGLNVWDKVYLWLRSMLIPDYQ